MYCLNIVSYLPAVAQRLGQIYSIFGITIPGLLNMVLVICIQEAAVAIAFLLRNPRWSRVFSFLSLFKPLNIIGLMLNLITKFNLAPGRRVDFCYQKSVPGSSARTHFDNKP